MTIHKAEGFKARGPYLSYSIQPGDGLMDVLSRIISNIEKEGKIDSYLVNEAKSVSHLIYADDVLIFLKENQKSLKGIKEALLTFSTNLNCLATIMSRLGINL